MSDWKKEIARDLMALGSIPFYFIVIARSLVGEHYLFAYQTLIALVFIHINGWRLKFNRHLSRIISLIVFTIIFYNQTIYSIFAVLVGLIMFGSLFYLKESYKKIGYGLIVGVIAVLLGYYLAPLI